MATSFVNVTPYRNFFVIAELDFVALFIHLLNPVALNYIYELKTYARIAHLQYALDNSVRDTLALTVSYPFNENTGFVLFRKLILVSS